MDNIYVTTIKSYTKLINYVKYIKQNYYEEIRHSSIINRY